MSSSFRHYPSLLASSADCLPLSADIGQAAAGERPSSPAAPADDPYSQLSQGELNEWKHD